MTDRDRTQWSDSADNPDFSDIALGEVIGQPVPTRYWHILDDGRLQCDMCPRFCKLRDGQRGLCFVRAAQDGAIVLTTYGRSSGFCIDPIEKKPLNHFLPGTPILSFGTAGCNLACVFCQNWSISKSRQMDRVQNIAAPDQIARAARSLNCASVAFTYNDPVIFHEYAIDIADACRADGIRTVAVTAGYVCPEPRREFYERMDAANIDLKAFSEAFYHRHVKGHLEPVLDTLRYVYHETDTWLEITTLVIPGENDSPHELRALAEWIGTELGPEVPLHFSAFHPDYKMNGTPKTPRSLLAQARQIALKAGLHHVYTGNIDEIGRQSTYCAVCGDRLITRRGYELSGYRLSAKGECLTCGSLCAGRFDGPPGRWGRRRQAVDLTGFR